MCRGSRNWVDSKVLVGSGRSWQGHSVLFAIGGVAQALEASKLKMIFVVVTLKPLLPGGAQGSTIGSSLRDHSLGVCMGCQRSNPGQLYQDKIRTCKPAILISGSLVKT